MFTKKLCYLAMVTISFALVNLSIAEMSVSPFGISVFVEDEDVLERELVIGNNTDNDVEFNIRTSLVANDEENRRGPERDNLGDVLEEIDVGAGHWIGMAWDGELMWGLAILDRASLIAVTPDGEIVEELQLDIGYVYGMCWDGEAFWLGNWESSELTRMDTEGNILRSININPPPPFGITWDGENLWYGGYRGEDQVELIQQISLDGEILRTLNTDVLEGDRIIELCWVPEHIDGHLWVVCCDTGLLYQLNIEQDDVEVVQQLEINREAVLSIEHDYENLWYSAGYPGSIWYIIDDGAMECRILQVDPTDGVIAGNESETIDLVINPEGLEEGIYHTLLEIEFPEPRDRNDQPIEAPIMISVVVSFDSPSAQLTVIVTDQENGDPIEDVEVALDRFYIKSLSNEEGRCEFEALPPDEYELTFSAVDYLTMTEQYRIDGEGEVLLEVEMQYAEFTTDLEEIAVDLDINEIREINFEVTNTGSGPLSFNSELCLFDNANAEPYELRTQIMAGEILDEIRVQGAVFNDGFFYIAIANNREPQIAIMNTDGQVLNRYAQQGRGGSYGYKDLDFDGELIWGSLERTIYAFTPDGELVREIISPHNPTTNIAYDSDRELLWVSSTTTDIVGIDREGNQVAQINRGEVRIYGLSYWEEDPDGFNLYAFHKDNEIGRQLISKFNPETGECVFVNSLEPENEGEAVAAFITNQYDIYSWVYMAVINDGAQDRIDIWQLDVRTDWMELVPTEGIIDPDDACEFTLTLNATGLPEEIFEAEIVFSHDGIGRETIIPITMAITDENEIEERILQLHQGWNMASVNVEPESNDIIEMTQELVENDLLQILKNGGGQFYVPEHNFCNIQGWNVAEGYQINMLDAGEWSVMGIPVDFDTPIPLSEGWQIVSYYPRIDVDQWIAFSGIIDELILAKDEFGHFLNPEFNFGNLWDLTEGLGYLVKLREDTDLIWCVERDEGAANHNQNSVYNIQPSLLPAHRPTDENMSLLVIGDNILKGEVGVFANGNLVGSAVIQEGICGIAVWGDDSSTPEIDGALPGDKLEIQYHSSSNKQSSEAKDYSPRYDVISGTGLYETDSFMAIKLLDVAETPSEFGIVSVHPNPFNSSTNLSYYLPEAGNINLSLFDLSGREVTEIISKKVEAGLHSANIDGTDLSSGVYVASLSFNGINVMQKVVLVR